MLLEVAVIIGLAVTVAVFATKVTRTLAHQRPMRTPGGTEHERLADEGHILGPAEALLAPLDHDSRSRFAVRWGFVLNKFTYDPTAAIADAQRLVLAVLRELGYPIMQRDQLISDLSADHPSLRNHFRSTCDISDRSAAGLASAYDICQVLADYSALFAVLLARPASMDLESARAEAISGHRGRGMKLAERGS
jgi:hypothetical protein